MCEKEEKSERQKIRKVRITKVSVAQSKKIHKCKREQIQTEHDETK